MKDIIQKLLKAAPETALTEEERAKATAFDLEAALNSAAAAARRKAEEDVAKLTAALKSKEDALKAKDEEHAAALKAKDDENAQLKETIKGRNLHENAEVLELRKLLESERKEREAAKAETAKLQRNNLIDSLIEKAGFKYAAGFDGRAINSILHSKLEALDDDGLKEIDEADTPFDSLLHGQLFKNHRDKWKGALLDESGKGSGSPASGRAPVGGFKGPNPWKADTTNLTERRRISMEDPQLAAQLKAEAGFKDPA